MQRFARWLLRLFGWRVAGEVPAAPKYVLLAVPHTSNWDGFFFLLMKFALGLKLRWMGKHTLFEGPLGKLLLMTGGMPIRRDRKSDVVRQVADAFAAADELIVAVPPEGTRSRSDYWKSGFYHIARAAGVPVALTYLDYSRKIGGFGPLVELTGDIAADMDRIRAFYADKHGKFPAKQSPMRLREEDAPEAAAGGAVG